MSKGQQKSNREVRKPKKEAAAKSSGAPPSYLNSVIRKPAADTPKRKK